MDWEDVRVQSWSGEERQENGDYMEKGLEVQKGIGALEVGRSSPLSMPSHDILDSSVHRKVG